MEFLLYARPVLDDRHIALDKIASLLTAYTPVCARAKYKYIIANVERKNVKIEFFISLV